MKKRRLPAAAALAAALQIVSCGVEKPQIETRVKVLMGTEVAISAWGAGKGRDEVGKALGDAFRRMEGLEKIFSRWIPDSELSKINLSAGTGPVKAGPEIVKALLLAREVWKVSGGAFDPTVGPLVSVWTKAGKSGILPAEEEIEAARRLTGFEGAVIDAEKGTVSLPEGFSLDLGGIAKGFIVDEAARVLKESGLSGGLVEAGGDIFAFGGKPDGSRWSIGVQDPAAGEEVGPEMAAVLKAGDIGVTTSGHYRRFSTIAGKRYSHIIDPRTGRPVEQAVSSVTVIAGTAALADGLSTAVSVMGIEKGLAMIDSTSGVEALLLLPSAGKRWEIRTSKGMDRYISRSARRNGSEGIPGSGIPAWDR